ncbi:hypothetical protein ACROYT_G009547 [Oculina patagonica]
MATNNTSAEGAANSTSSTVPITVHGGATVWMTIAYVVIFIFGFFGNACVIYIVASRKRMKSTFNFLIVNMAIGDLLVTLFIMPFEVKFLYAGQTWISGGLGSVTCKFVYFSGVLSIAATIITLVFISLDRYFAILHPFVDVPVIRNTKLVTSVIWISSSLYFSLYLVLFDSVPTADGSRFVCRMVWNYLYTDRAKQFEVARAYFMTTFVVLYLIPLAAIAGLYIPIGRRLWSREIPGVSTAHQKRQNESSKRKVLRMLIIVVVTFALCWLPTHIMHLLGYFFTEKYKALLAIGHVETSFYFLSHANSAINPCLYIFLNQRFNLEFKNILRSCFCRPPKANVNSAQSVYQNPSEGTVLMRNHSSST